MKSILSLVSIFVLFSSYAQKDTLNNVSLSFLETGYSKSLEIMTYCKGSLFKNRKLSHTSIFVKHPKGNFLFDAGLSENFKQQVKKDYSWFQSIILKSTYKPAHSVKKQFEENNYTEDSIQFIIASHLHFDHMSGIIDFPNTPLWVSPTAEKHESLFLNQQLINDSTRKKTEITFDSIPYQGFETSYDIFKDSSCVLVPLEGHTHGSIGLFVTTSSKQQYFFIGDATWVAEGFIENSEKSLFTRMIVDSHRESSKHTIEKLHNFYKKHPQIKIIPSHDHKLQQKFNHFPKFED